MLLRPTPVLEIPDRTYGNTYAALNARRILIGKLFPGSGELLYRHPHLAVFEYRGHLMRRFPWEIAALDLSLAKT